ncbi:MAG: TonB-dependent receptor [Opitutae bacterium]|nr:TonB-dependent receptor [Opitutae bacterium]
MEINNTPQRRAASALLLLAFSSAALLRADDDSRGTKLPEFVVTESRVANDEPAGTLAMPVSALRYEPRVDVQARNFAEAQADVSIRGGVFESTGVRVGAAALSDPQTGHYFFELPVSPELLRAPAVLTGLDNAAGSFNAGTGTVEYAWSPVRTGGRASLAAGEHGFRRESLYGAATRAFHDGRDVLGADFAVAQSKSHGAIPFGDHDFSRANGRLQWRTANAQTDAFVGYQRKFFGWPNLYTPFGFNETENLQTVLAVVNHSWHDAHGNKFAAAAFYRRNKDDYEFNRAVPGASNPFQHTTWLRGVDLAGRVQLAEAAVRYSLDVAHDNLQSTALTFGRFHDRTLSKATLVPEIVTALGDGQLISRAGATFDRSDRDGSAWSPLAGLSWSNPASQGVRLEYSETTQLPSYTALNSNAAAGLFRGNPNLGRSRARNLELGASTEWRGWKLEAAAFRRWDDQLVDWTFRTGVIARTANPVDTVTDGLEALASYRSARVDATLGYAWLHKRSDYGSASIDASFYALNFPEHRATAAVRWRLGGGFELRSDNEYRVQTPNVLRTTGGRHALLSSAGLYYLPPAWRGWEFSAIVDNLWDSDFQEVPAVPASPRQWAVAAAFRW